MQISQFPDFTDFDIGLKEEYNELFEKFPPYTDFSFGTLCIWLNQNKDLKISRIQNAIICEYTNLFTGNEKVLSVLADKNTDLTIKTLFEYQKSKGKKQRLSIVPATTIESIQHPSDFKITPQPDNFNYILMRDGLSEPEGAKFAKFRYEVRHFQKQYEGRYKVASVDLSDPDESLKIYNTLSRWHNLFTANDEGRQEELALASSFRNANKLKLRALRLDLDDHLIGLAIFQEPPQKGYIICNHLKVERSVQYSFNFLLHCLAQKMKPEQNFINFEQDLGIPGLRFHKTKLNPVFFLNNYEVRPA